MWFTALHLGPENSSNFCHQGGACYSALVAQPECWWFDPCQVQTIFVAFGKPLPPHCLVWMCEFGGGQQAISAIQQPHFVSLLNAAKGYQGNLSPPVSDCAVNE